MRTWIRGKDLRDDDRCDFVGDNGLGLVVVDVDCLKGAHAKRLPAVGHSVDMDTLERGRYRNRLWCGTGSCTHAPQAAVNHIAADSETGNKHTHTHADTAVTRGVYLGSNNTNRYSLSVKNFSVKDVVKYAQVKLFHTDIIQLYIFSTHTVHMLCVGNT